MNEYALTWIALTAMINEIRGPQSFLRDLLFPRSETLHTEHLELSYLVGDRVVAPYVRKNGEALLVEGLGQAFAIVEAPNIRIKRPFTPSDLLFTRRAGTTVHVSPQAQISALNRHIANDLQHMKNMIVNAEEVQASQALTGAISYRVEDEETFEVTVPRQIAPQVAATWWDDATSFPEEDFKEAKRLISDETGLSPTHVLLGRDAGTEFVKNPRVTTLLDNRRIQAGGVTYTSQFTPQGAIYLGDFSGLQVWEYGRQLNVRGTMTSLIAPNSAIFVAATPEAQWKRIYGAIADYDALKARKFQGQIFSKSWVEPDPSVLWALAHSRPLCLTKRPDAVVPMQVLA